MNKLLVTGGTGLLGREIINQLLRKRQKVSILTRQTNLAIPAKVEIFQGDLLTGEGLSKALENTKTIIHCASNPRAFQDTDILGAHNLLKAIDRKQPPHFIYISIVGVDRSDYPYYIAKKQVEDMIAESGIPFTILRTTQFHHFVYNMIKGILENKDETIQIPDRMNFQSVDISEVAEKLIEIANATPAGLLSEFGGPEVLTFEKMFLQYLENLQLHTAWEALPLVGLRYDLFRSGINLCPTNTFGKITWEKFLINTFKS